MSINHYKLLFFLTILLTSFSPAKRKIKVYLIGDSTMSVKPVEAYPEAGWGMPFKWFFNDSVEVDNRALNGRSSRSFFEEQHWKPIVDSLETGDFVFIQFGHNDEVPTKKTYTTEEDYVKFLKMYVKETQAKNAFPILVTPVTRRKFDSNGKVEDTHKTYAELVRKTAKQLGVPLIDLSAASMSLLQSLGEEQSRFLYLFLEPEQNPNHPAGRIDNTHFSEYGARRMAELVLAEIRKQNLPLKKYIVNPSSKK